MTVREALDEALPAYMAMGMSPEEYWRGDTALAPAYRKAWEARRDADEWRDWTLGQYMSAAIGSALSSKVSYPEEPLPLTARKEAEGRRRHERLEAIKAKAIAWANAFNASRGGTADEQES